MEDIATVIDELDKLGITECVDDTVVITEGFLCELKVIVDDMDDTGTGDILAKACSLAIMIRIISKNKFMDYVNTVISYLDLKTTA